MSFLFRFRGILLAMALAALTGAVYGDDPLPERVQFNRDVRPILSDICFHCHGPDQAKREANLRFDTEAGASIDLGEGRKAIVAGKPEQSELVRRIMSVDPDVQMPPPALDRQLSSRQIAILRRWVEQGAKWDAHWSFVKPVQTTQPVVKQNEWA